MTLKPRQTYVRANVYIRSVCSPTSLLYCDCDRFLRRQTFDTSEVMGNVDLFLCIENYQAAILNHYVFSGNKVTVYGYSIGFGRCDHSLTANALRDHDPNLEVDWNNDGY